MNPQQFYRWMDSPAELGAESLVALKQLLDDYPYFQAAQLLYLLNLRRLDDYRFGHRLRICAVHSPDRARLKQLVDMVDSLNESDEADTPAVSQSASPAISSDNPRIKSIEQQIKESLSEIEEKQLKINRLLEERKSIIGESPELALPGKASEEPSPRRPLPKDELLDDFIRASSPLERKSPAFFSPEESARKSIEENYSVISETLARLVAAQGKHEEAIKIYQQLMLKNPQKSSYFAAQIEKLRKEL